MMKAQVSDVHLYFYELICNKHRHQELILGSEIISRIKYSLYRAPIGLYWAIIEEMTIIGLLEKINETHYRLGKANMQDLSRINTYRKSPRKFPIPI